MIDLGYNSDWIKLGIVSEVQIQDEIKNFHNDPHPEHWRYRNLDKFIKQKIELSEDEFEMINKLIVNDPDKIMITSFCIQMIHNLKLTSYQLRMLNIFFSINGNDDLFFKENSKRKLINNEMNENEFLELLCNENMHHVIYENSNKVEYLEKLYLKTKLNKLKNKTIFKIKILKKMAK